MFKFHVSAGRRALAVLLVLALGGLTTSGCILFEDPAEIEGIDVFQADTQVQDDSTSNDVQADLEQCSDNNPNSCGGACVDCFGLPNVGNADCNAGACVIVACDPGFLDCDLSVGTGCELAESDRACGPDCTSCLDRAHSVGGSCVDSTCALDCEAGFNDCDGFLNNGCEEPHTQTSCGPECLDCSNLPNVEAATCGSDTCVISACEWGFLDCDGLPGNGCEAPFQDSACGAACDLDCTALAGVADARCAGDTCAIVACDPDARDANNSWDDGCEESCALGQCWSDSTHRFLGGAFDGDTGVGILATNAGDFYFTEDHGLSWFLHTTPTDANLASIAYNGINMVWAVSANGDLLSSDNGGLNWSIVLLPLGINKPRQVAAHGDLVILVNAGTLVRSRDGGATWQDLSSTIGGVDLRGVHVSGQQIMLAGSGGEMFRSDNAGDTLLPVASLPVGTPSVRFKTDGNRLYAGGAGFLFYTEDRGLGWTPVAGLPEPQLAWTDYDVDGDFVVLVAGNQFAYLPTGADAAFVSSIAEGDTLTAVHIVDGEARLFGYNGDFGHTFETTFVATEDPQRVDYSRLDLTHAWFDAHWLFEEGSVILSGGGANGLLLRSEDDGLTWDTVDSGTTQAIVHVALPTLDEGIMAAAGDNVIRTTDGAVGWGLTLQGANYVYTDAAYDTSSGSALAMLTGQNQGIPAVFVGTVESSASMNWVPTNCNTPPACSLVLAGSITTAVDISGVKAVMGTSFGEVVRSADSGATWTTVLGPLGGQGYVADVLYEGTHILLFTLGGALGSEIYYSPDDGAGWPSAAAGVAVPVFDGTANSVFLNAWDWDGSVGVAVGRGGAVVRSEDGGQSWAIIQNDATTADLSLVRIDGNTVIAASTGGTIVYSEDAGLTFGATQVDLRGRTLGDISIDNGRAILVAPNGQVLFSR